MFRKLHLVGMALMLALGVHAQLPSSQISLIADSEDQSIVRFEIEGVHLETVTTPEGTAYKVQFEEGTPILKAGAPDLQKLTTSVVIDRKANTVVEFVDGEYTDYENVLVAPSKGNLYRNVDPSSVAFEYGEAYNTDAFFPSSVIEGRTPYIMRDVRGQALVAHPVQYNPVTKTLRVWEWMEVAVTATNEIGENAMLDETPVFLNEQFADLMDKQFLNFQQSADRYDLVYEIGSMLIITVPEYMETLEPFVQWKREKGFETTVVDVAEMGNTVSQIGDYIADMYNEVGLTYVLIVGDEDQITSEFISNGGGDGFCDPCYAYIAGSDHYLDLHIGRFLVHNNDELISVVDKTLEYEKDPYTATNWFDTAVGIGSDEGPGDDGEYDWEHNNGIKEDLLSFTYESVYELYDANHTAASPTGGETADGSGNPSAQNLIDLIDDGCTMINYTGHGWHSGIATTGFDNNSIGQLQNPHLYPYMVVVGCCVGDFDNSDGQGDCFGEAWLKQTYNGQPAGGIGGGFSSVFQSWSPPMEAQDEMKKLIAESGQQEIRHTLSGILFHGCHSMNEAYGNAGDEMTDTWCLFGDPSVTLRTAYPEQLVVDHNPSAFVGVSSVDIICDVNDAYISLTFEGEILGTALVQNGMATVEFDEPFSNVGDILVTGTAFNHIPYQDVIEVVPADGPYVIDESIMSDDQMGNNNDQVDYAESILLDVSLENVGIETAFGVNAVISTDDPFITITDDNHYYGDIDPENILLETGAFGFDVADGVEDQHVALFTLTVTDTDMNEWTQNFTVLINAPELDTDNITIDDSNGNNDGRLNSGETVDVMIPSLNIGHSASVEALGELFCASSYLTLNNVSYDLGAIAADGTVDAVFNITVADDVPDGSIVELEYDVTAGMYTASRTYEETINLIMEDWEAGDLEDSAFPWVTEGASDWFTTDFDPFEGNFCMQSGAIGDGDNTDLVLTLEFLQDGEITFARKTSTEDGWDILYFYIDGNEMGAWSGEQDWATESFNISAGVHELKWEYYKDQWCCVEGMDAVWVDDITFPPYDEVNSVSESTSEAFGLLAIPNPFNDQAKLNITSAISGSAVLTITNIDGRIISETSVALAQGMTQVDLDLSSEANGMYFVSLSFDGQISTTRVIKR